MKEFHPIAELFPLMQGNDFAKLKQSISLGFDPQAQPIFLLEGKVLDGRNRERACEETGVEPRYEQYTGSKPMEFVASQNLIRRHLTISQRAKIAEKMATMTKGGDRKSKPGTRLRSLRQTAKIMDVGHASVEAVRYVRDHAIPEVIQAMDEDKIKTEPASQIARLPKNQQFQALSDKLINGKSIVPRRKQKDQSETEPPSVKPKPPTRAEMRAEVLSRQREALDKVPSLRGLSREEVDPELADKPFEFSKKYGFVNLHTKAEVEDSKDKAAFSEWIGAVKKLKTPLKELLRIETFSKDNVMAWIMRTHDPANIPVRYAEMHEMVSLIKQAGDSVAELLQWLDSQK
jgi:hypothetical protein